MHNISFDVISDLNIMPDNDFSWVGKSTSDYCLIAGNLSSDVQTIVNTLLHLSKIYQGIYYMFGDLECKSHNMSMTYLDLIRVVEKIPNVSVMHKNVVVMGSLVVLSVNGRENIENEYDEQLEEMDFEYLRLSIKKLQLHRDIKNIVILTSSNPHKMKYLLSHDTEKKITHWFHGNNNDNYVENNIRYVSNSRNNNLYFPLNIKI
jgi:hypothetical protein